jgi:CelD/BcsL family acetyltransferase involved in cellulose biosynthesis
VNLGEFTVGPWEGSAAEWDAFVVSHPDARFCHLSGYLETVNAVYGFPARRFAVLRDGRISGVLAASACRSLVFGRKWVSVPYGEYGGFLLGPTLDSDVAGELLGAARGAAAAEGASVLEVNGILGLPEASASHFAAPVRYELAVLDLSPGAERLLAKEFKYEVRKAIRKAERAGLVTREASDPETIRRDFYPLWLRSMQRLGVPPHGPEYFLELKSRFGSDLAIEWTERGGQLVAALLGIRCGSRVQVIATASRPEDWEDRPNDLAHWGYIRRACDAGVRWFDFGSVRYEGQRHYKEKWAAVFTPAAHWILDLRASRVPKTFDSSSRTMELASRAWRKLVPESVATLLGPLVRKTLLR